MKTQSTIKRTLNCYFVLFHTFFIWCNKLFNGPWWNNFIIRIFFSLLISKHWTNLKILKYLLLSLILWVNSFEQLSHWKQLRIYFKNVMQNCLILNWCKTRPVIIIYIIVVNITTVFVHDQWSCTIDCNSGFFRKVITDSQFAKIHATHEASQDEHFDVLPVTNFIHSNNCFPAIIKDMPWIFRQFDYLHGYISDFTKVF